MERRKLLALTSAALSTLVAGCGSDGGGSDTASPTPSATPTPSPTPEPGRITSVDVNEIPDYGLNTLGFIVNLAELQSGVNYRVRITVESDAGSKTAVFGVRSEHGFQSPIAGGEITPAEGTTTDGTELTYRVELRKSGEVVDVREDTIEYE
jgi:hypothetical protein